MTSCAASITLDALVDYFDGALSAGESDVIEEHYFGCAACTRTLEAIARLAPGLRRLVREGNITFGLTAALRARLAADGLQLREYRVEPGRSVPCSAGPDDAFVVLRLVADLDRVTRARVTLADDAGLLSVEHDDLPIDPASGEVSVAYPGRLIRALPDLVVDVRLRTERDGREARESRYTLVHSHAAPADG